jgi:hypothetical protein
VIVRQLHESRGAVGNAVKWNDTFRMRDRFGYCAYVYQQHFDDIRNRAWIRLAPATSFSFDWTQAGHFFHQYGMSRTKLRSIARAISLQLSSCMHTAACRSSAGAAGGAALAELCAGRSGLSARQQGRAGSGDLSADQRGAVMRPQSGRCDVLFGRLRRVFGFVPVFVGLPVPSAIFPGVAQRVYR